MLYPDGTGGGLRSSLFVLVVLLGSAWSTPSALAQQPEGDRPLTAEERIKAATVPPPGKECPPDLEEAGHVDAAANAAALRGVSGSATETLSIAKQAVYQFWLARRVAFMLALEESAKAVHARPKAVAGALDEFINRDVCERLAKRDPGICDSGGDPRAGFQCRALMEMSKHRGGAEGHCDAVPAWFGPTCRLVFERDPDACDTAMGRTKSMCDMVQERLHPPGGTCAAPFQLERCSVEFLLAGVQQGPAICREAAINAGLDPARTLRLQQMCEAATTDDPSLCERIELGPPAEQITVEAHAELHGGMDGVRAVVGVASNSPVACAVRLTVRDGQRDVARTMVGGVWPVGRAHSVESALLAPAADPFRHQLQHAVICVPTMSWEKAGEDS